MMKKLILILTLLTFGVITANAQDSVDVTFQVNMSVKILEGTFDPLTEEITVPGGFNNWLNEPPANSTKTMEDPDGDSIYTRTYKVGSNATYAYKFNIGTGWLGGAKEETNNRSVIVTTSNLVLPVVWFNNDSIVSIQADGNILFEVDMSVMEEIGIFDNVNDSLQVRGSFNGWSGSDPAKSQMFQDPGNANKYFLNVPFVQVFTGDVQQYKFFVNKADTNDLWTDGYERPTVTGGGNRQEIYLGQSNQVAGEEYFESVSPEWVIEPSVNLSIIFSVDMRPAMDGSIQPVPFNPAEDSLWWISEQPTFVRSQGWEDTNEMQVLLLEDADGDSIYSGTLDIMPPAFNSFIYRYGFYDVSAASWTFEPEGFSNFAYRVRYIGQNNPRSFPFSPWNCPTDTWTNAEVKTDQEIDPYETLLGVGDDELVADKYELSQNFPNPFNPSTTIRFSIPEANLVSVKVFNLLGEEVTILINREMTAGIHEVNFNASALPTGVYFYTLRAGDFVTTKKMLLIK
jgi:hypothetical protein